MKKKKASKINCRYYNCNSEIIIVRLYAHTGWHSKKGDEGEYGEKSEHGKKGGDKKYKKWGHKKGH